MKAKKTKKVENRKATATKKVKGNGAEGEGSRTPLPRLLRIYAAIHSGKCPCSPVLAKKFGVSERTISRDVTYLRDQMLLPIAFDRERNTYYYTGKTVQLPGMQISIGEMMALLVARRSIEAHRGSGLTEQINSALEKITTFMAEDLAKEWEQLDSMISYRSQKPRIECDPTVFPVLSMCLRESQEVEFLYWKLGASAEELRRVRPLHLCFIEDTWYLFTHDLHREHDVRRFALPRIRQIRATGTRFERPEEFDPEALLAHSIGIYGGNTPERVRLRLGPIAGQFLAERPVHRSQRIITGPGGATELTMDVAINPELERMVMSWGEQVEVMEPLSLRQSVLRTAGVIVARG
ncbi:helix-turn-helix transcriptional regulator [Verrucomicrobiota bacterium sgz303538]